MVDIEGFVEYIVELIYNMVSKIVDYFRVNLLVIVYCIGVMNIIIVISIV